MDIIFFIETNLMNNTKVYWPDKLVKDLNFDEESHK